eukprot:CAMPEP_0118699850 /NCGR_PEP_ID=MMETSP0800-20121206/16174_1 /TAXON_ID=210618 ORGANISM="Striatella unipunctata, Strain CCMP2910" /NCGR_SAMPLE_ID=MMETSP0800 /ASSEMBLY_ACC=CAM_ASM_000638 /LENGTH=196 /DNA_ID=CAMNT_0006600205 /DNA_START=66 /DNA_END=656 /DNA_ORIENTATION=-
MNNNILMTEWPSLTQEINSNSSSNSSTTSGKEQNAEEDEWELLESPHHDSSTSFVSSLVQSVSSPDFDLLQDLEANEDVVLVRKGPVSFRDAILAQVVEEETKQQHVVVERRARPFKRANVVVTPVRRSHKSTGDLRAIAEVDESLDAMEYYHQKAKGFVSRKNGRKTRPDEATRKAMSIHKREMQRQQTKSKAKA